MKKSLAVLAVAVGMLCMPWIHGAETPRGEWMRGYVKMESADRAMAAGKGGEALEFYRGAQEVFERVLRKYPTWNESLLNYRIKYCKEQIEKLGQSVGAQSQEMNRENLLKLTKDQHAAITKLTEERKVLQSRVEVLAESLEKARGEAARQAGIETSLAETTRVNAQLKEKLQLTELKLHEAEKEVARLKVEEGMAAELKKTEDKLKLTAAQLEKVQKSLTDTRIENEKLDRQGKLQGIALDAANREREDQKMVIQVVRELANARKKDNEGLLARYETLEKKLADALANIKEKDAVLAQNAERIAQMLAEIDGLHALKTADLEKAYKKQTEELNALRESLEQLAVGAKTESAAGNESATVRRKTMENLARHLKTKDAEIARLAASMATLFGDRERMMAQEEELAQLKRQAVELAGERDRQRALALTNQENYMTVKGDVDRVKTQLAAAEARCADLAAEIDNARRNRNAKLAEAKISAQELEGLREKLAASQGKATQLATQLTDQVGLAKRLEAEAKALREQLAAESAKAQSAQNDFRQTVQKLKEQLTSAQAQAKSEKARLASVEKKTASKDAQVKSMGGELDDLKRRLQEVSERLRMRDAAIAFLQKDLQAVKGHETELAQREAERQNAQVKQSRDNIQALDSAHSRMQQQTGKLSERENALLALQKRYDEQAAILMRSEGAASELRSILGELQIKFKALEEADAALAKKLKSSEQKSGQLENELNIAQASVNSLERKNSEMTDKVGAVDGMVKAVVEANALKDKSNAENIRYKNRIAMVEGQLREADVKNRLLQKQLKDAIAAGNDAQSKQLRTLMEQLDKAEKRVKALEDVLVENESEKQQSSLTASQSRQISALNRMNDALRRQNKLLTAQTEELAANDGRQSQDSYQTNKIKALNATLETLAAELEVEKAKNGTPSLDTQSGETATAEDVGKERERREHETAALLRGYIHQGLDAERQGKVEAARWNYQKVLSLDSDNKTALQRLGQLAYNQGDDAAAIRYLKRAFYHDPDDPQTLFALGYSYARQSKPDWAVATMGRAVALNPENASMARVYGATLTQLGWTDAAEREFRRALKLDPKEKDAAFNLAVLLMTSASEKGMGLTAAVIKKLRDNSRDWLASRDENTRKLVTATLDWLDYVARQADAKTGEARKLYNLARENGVAPDPALEAKLK